LAAAVDDNGNGIGAGGGYAANAADKNASLRLADANRV
jgi:hypothetical protein